MPKEGHANGARGTELVCGDVVLLAAFIRSAGLLQ